jgi:ribose transport system substrate-binding protein
MSVTENDQDRLYHPVSCYGLLSRRMVSLADSKLRRMVQMYYLMSVRIPISTLESSGTITPERKRYPANPWLFSRPPKKIALAAAAICLFLLPACNRVANTVAIIPRACGTVLWEPEHAGAANVAKNLGINLYWNAPTREDDVAGQIDLLENVVSRRYRGIIITPDQTLPFRSPIRRIVASGLPMVVVGTDLGISPTANLSYVLNDDALGGQMGARRLGKILNGRGSIAILGINPQLTGITIRERAFENTLEREFPDIHVVVRRLGYYSVPQEQQGAEDILNRGDAIDAIVALSHIATRGAFYALVEFDKTHTIKLIGFDQDLMPPIRTGELDSVIMQRTYDMGRTAMQLMDAQLHRKAVVGVNLLPPILMTRDNIDSPEITRELRADWWRR